MKKYLIYTVNDTEPFVVETEEDLIKDFCYAWNTGEPLYVEHKKELLGLGTYKYSVMMNVNQIVSITSSEKV